MHSGIYIEKPESQAELFHLDCKYSIEERRNKYVLAFRSILNSGEPEITELDRPGQFASALLTFHGHYIPAEI